MLEENVLRILFDQGTPITLRDVLLDHIVCTAYEKGWSALRNGELLKVAQTQFDAFVTTDKNLYHQQNLTELRLSILVLPFASWPKLKMHLETITLAINELKPGDYVELSFTKKQG